MSSVSRFTCRRPGFFSGRGILPFWLAAFLSGFIGLSAPAIAVETTPDAMSVTIGQGELLQFSRAAKTVFIADPAIADIQVPSARSVFILGKKPGFTTLFALAADDHVIARLRLTVQRDIAAVNEALQRTLPEATLLIEPAPNGVILSGTVADAATADRAVSLAKAELSADETVINRLTVRGPLQVNLRVKVAEVSRSVSKELGFNWSSLSISGDTIGGILIGREFLSNAVNPGLPASFGSTVFSRAPSAGINSLVPQNTVISGVRSGSNNSTLALDALAEQGLITILAEPNLTAISGEAARFLVGGEFPVPVPQNFNQVTIQFKPYGISLEFVPTVSSRHRISLKVRPEVSELTQSGAITINNIEVPALAVRRAETTIELGSGQSFAIAGLIQNNTSGNINKFPGLGDIPILGALFRSSNFQRNESELVIVVTPYIVEPVRDPSAIRLPTDTVAPASDLERILFQRLAAAPEGSGKPVGLGLNGMRLEGDAGFIVP